MQISMWSSYLYELSPEDMVRTFVQHSWNCTELSSEHGWMLLKRGQPTEVGRELKQFAEDYDFSFPQGHFYLGADIAHPDEKKRLEIMDDMKRWCDLFAALNISAGVLHPGGKGMRALGYAPEKILECNVEALEKISDFVQGGPTTICLENGGSIENMLGLLNAVRGSGLGLCLDTGHLNMAGGDCRDFILKAGERLKALHITDSIGSRDDHILPYGAGTINWEELIKALREVGYEGLFNFEVPRENRCPMKIRLAKLDYTRQLAMLMVHS
ncbi:MAG: hypothetical protein AMS15_06325 [Planctomycetes bacterium DG_23]|nr:MAG: hypothetical protein AMS15_06325 [Planctomycetes bacterium DG_23]